jgi:hypothetical protein
MTREIFITWVSVSMIVFFICWHIQCKYDLFTWWFALGGMFISVAAGETVIYLLSL